VALDGTENAVRRVKVINLPKHGGNSEAWGISLSGFNVPDSEANMIDGCEISHFSGGGGITALNLANCSGIMRNNRVFLSPDPGPNIQQFGLNSGWIHDVLIEGNLIDGANVGYNADTGGGTNVIVAHNSFINVAAGIALHNYARQNLTFAFNDIEFTNLPGIDLPVAFFLDQSSSGSFTNVFIFGNTVRFIGSGTAYFVVAENTTGLTIVNNAVDSSLANSFSGDSNLNIDNNYDLYGNYLSSLNIPMLGGTPATSFGLSLVGSAGASPALTALGLPSNPLAVVTNGSTQPVIFDANVTVNGALNYSNMVAQIIAGIGITSSTVNTSTGQVVTVNANSQTNTLAALALVGAVPLTSLQNAITNNEATQLVMNNSLLFSSEGLSQITLNAAGTYWGQIGNPSAQVWSLGFGPSSAASTYTSILSWTPYNGVTISPQTGTATNFLQVLNTNSSVAFGVNSNGIAFGNGGGLTSLNASQLTSGTMPLTQLSGAVVTNGSTQPVTFNANVTMNSALVLTNAGTLNSLWSSISPSNAFLAATGGGQMTFWTNGTLSFGNDITQMPSVRTIVFSSYFSPVFLSSLLYLSANNDFIGIDNGVQIDNSGTEVLLVSATGNTNFVPTYFQAGLNAATNTASFQTISNVFSINNYFTNNTTGRIGCWLPVLLTNGTSGDASLAVTNLNTTESYSVGLPNGLGSVKGVQTLYWQMSPNDVILVTNITVTGSGTGLGLGKSFVKIQ
jgi:hypothetical protein